MREITAAGIFSEHGERYVVIEYDDGSAVAFDSQWFEAADCDVVNGEDEDAQLDWLRAVARNGADDWQPEGEEALASRLLGGDGEGIGIIGVGAGW